MTNKSKFLKNLLTTASALAVAAGAVDAMAEARLVTGAAVKSTGANLDQNGVPANVPFAAGSTLTFRGAHTFDMDGAPTDIAGIMIDSNVIGTLDAANTAANSAFNIGSISKVAGKTGSLTINTGAVAAVTITLTGTASNVQTYLKAGDPGNNWAFNAQANDYSGLGAIVMQNAGDVVILNNATNFNATINGAGADQGEFRINGNDITLGGVIGATRLGKLTVNDGKSGTLNNTANVKAIQIGNGSTLTVGASKNVTAETVDGAALDQGTLSFAGASTAAINKVGNGFKVNKVVIGAGEVNFSTTEVYKATTTHLAQATSVVTFSKNAALDLNTNFTTETSGQGQIKLSNNDRTFKGAVGTDAKRIGNIHSMTNKTYTFDQADAKIYVDSFTTEIANEGKLALTANGIELYADVGDDTKAFDTVTVGSGAGSITRFKEDITVTANGGVTIKSAGGADDILELYSGSKIVGSVNSANGNKGIISVKGDATITKGIIANAINQIRFDAANTLTLGKNVITTNGGVNFLQDGTLVFGDNSNVTLDKATTVAVNANGVGTINVDAVLTGNTVTVTGQVGDVNAADTMLKLLSARGGANIILTNANIAIKKIDIEGKDSTLTLNKAAGNYMIGNFSHSDGQGTLAIAENLTLKKGTNLSSGAINTMKAVSFTDAADKTLTIEDGINFYTTNGVDGGFRNTGDGRGTLIFQGDSTVGAVVGLNAKFNEIKVTGANKTVTFKEKVNLAANVTISQDATAVFEAQVLAAQINSELGGNKGTVKFANRIALTDANAVDAKIGQVKLATVELAGTDITFTEANGVFSTSKLAFSSANAMTATFTKVAANVFQNTVITSTGNGNHNIVISDDNQQFDTTVGTAANHMGTFKFTTDKNMTFNSDFFGSVATKTNNEGTLILAGLNSVADNIGAAGFQLKSVQFKANMSAGNVYAKTMSIDAGNTVKFTGTVSSDTDGLTLNNGSVAEFGSSSVIASAINGGVVGQGTARFTGNNTIGRNIGESKGLDRIEFNGVAGETTNLGANLFANNIVAGAQTLNATSNVALNGASTFTGSRINLGTNNVTLQNGASTISGAGVVGLTLNSDKAIGSLTVDGSKGAASLNAAGLTSLALVITDGAALPAATEVYTVLNLTNGGTINNVNPALIDITQPSGNRFVKWSANNQLQLLRDNNAKQVLTGILGKLNDAELLNDGLAYGNAANKGDALAYASELSRMTDAQIVESLERITESTAIHANPVVNQVTGTVNQGINNRIATLTNHPMPGIQTSQVDVSGIAAGEGDSKYGAWVSPFYNTSIQKEQSSRAGYSSKAYGATVGFDLKANDDMTIGLAGSYVKTDVKHKNFKSGDKTKLNTYMISLYGIQQLTDAWFLQGNASYASSRVKNTEKRVTLTGSQKATGSFDATSYSGELLAGYNHKFSDVVVTPMIGARYVRVNDGGYKETGTTNQNLSVSSKASNRFEAILGLRAQTTMNTNGIDLTPEFHAFVNHDFVGKSAKVTVTHSGLATPLTTKAAKVNKTTFNVGLGVNAVSGMFEYGAGYDCYLAKKLVGHQGTLKVRVNF
ncbi:MAG: autotransporter domain-containing protein [Rickettsiales bacterium]|nr:autotransporter domain-containing protein [Rickettsiales bacterium]